MEIKVVRKVLEENEVLADDVRKKLKQSRQSLFNFMSSPGSGKTRLLETLIPKIMTQGTKVGVIEGDISTANDAVRLQPLGIPIALINTEPFGGECHLGAHVILGALEQLEKDPMDMVLIENVGNLVCPAEFDTGADYNVVLLSVTEGEDKPLKYPLMFRTCRLALITKSDLTNAVEANVELIKTNIRKINPEADIIEVSAKTGAGLDHVADWFLTRHHEILKNR